MKKQDIYILVAIVIFAGALSFIVSNKIIAPPEKMTAEVVTKITPSFQLPEKRHISDLSFNPTVRIEIAPNTNPDPFLNSNN